MDIAGGRLARAPTPEGHDPVAAAVDLGRAGARWVHVVDLDHAHGRGDNRDLIYRLLAAVPRSVAIQVGGGVVDEVAVAELLDAGAARIVLGTSAATDAALVDRVLERHGAGRVAIAIDAREGRLAPRGLPRPTSEPGRTVRQLAHRLQAQGAAIIVYTDVVRDGALTGPDLDGARVLADSGFAVIVGGGVSSLDDLRTARTIGLAGAIVGRALLEGRFTVAEALACVA